MLFGCCCHSTFEDMSARLSRPPHIPIVHPLSIMWQDRVPPGHLLMSNIDCLTLSIAQRQLPHLCPWLNNIASRCPLLTKRGLSVCARPSRNQSWNRSHCSTTLPHLIHCATKKDYPCAHGLLENNPGIYPMRRSHWLQPFNVDAHALPRSMDAFDPNQSRMPSNVIAFDSNHHSAENRNFISQLVSAIATGRWVGGDICQSCVGS
jgi:hypothetical protein